MTAFLCSICLAAAGVAFDAESHSVTVEAKSTDCGVNTDVEFLLVGPGSEHEYEAMFVTVATPADIAQAFDKAGIPRGRCVDEKGASFWPAGVRLEMAPAFTNLVRETRGETTPPQIYTGGRRDPSDAPEAATNAPCAVFALYGCAQSLIQLNDALDQSDTYGRFRPAVKIPQGEARKITFTWRGGNDWSPYDLRLEPGNCKDALVAMKEAASSNELSVTAFFSPEMTVGEAAKCASALAELDSPRVKINGFPDGHFFYRAFLPREEWRERQKRLCQPPEVHFTLDGKIRVVEIKEDWSGDESSLEPKLTESQAEYPDIASAAKAIPALAERTAAVLVFAPKALKLDSLYALKKGVSRDGLNWFIFAQ